MTLEARCLDAPNARTQQQKRESSQTQDTDRRSRTSKQGQLEDGSCAILGLEARAGLMPKPPHRDPSVVLGGLQGVKGD